VPSHVPANPPGVLAAHLVHFTESLGPTGTGSAEAVYEVIADPPYAGVWGPETDTFVIRAALFGISGNPLAFPAATVFGGALAPVDSTSTSSPTAPRPRF
jgi:hypothetical protein